LKFVIYIYNEVQIKRGLELILCIILKNRLNHIV